MMLSCAPCIAGMVDMDEGPWKSYEWLVVVGAIVAFLLAWGIGANDVANAFATTVGSGTVQLWQACIIAACFEFVGAIALGAQVSKTVSGNITDPTNFAAEPEVFGFGMLCALVGAWLWMTLATYLELAVSSTHSVIGAVLGFGLVYGGTGAIKWAEKTDDFPFSTGFITVVIAWFASPILSGLASFVIFILNRTLVLRRENSTEAAFYAFPPLVLITVFINIFFVLYKGAAKKVKWDGNQAAWVSAIIALGCAVISVPPVFYLRHRHYHKMEEAEQNGKVEMQMRNGGSDAANGSDRNGAEEEWRVAHVHEEALCSESPPEPTGSGSIFKRIYLRIKAHMVHALTMDVHQDVVKSASVAAMHAGAEVFNHQTESVYQYLQVFSACCVSFGHGANDVANSVGPFAGIWYVYNNRKVSATAPTPLWILVLGGSGIVIGLSTYGYNIIKVLGVQLAKITPARGFSAELSAALVISVASVFGLPISSTHCIVGAEVGVGLAEGHLKGTNWRLFGKTACGWIMTLVVAGLISAALFAVGVYSPSVINLHYIETYQNMMLNSLRSQLLMLSEGNQQGQDAALQGSLQNATAALNAAFDLQSNGHINQYDMQQLFQGINELFRQYQVVGQ